jgi:hypothetical protein
MVFKLNEEKNFVKFIENSVGINTFRNLYMTDDSGLEFDAANNGKKSCALFVTAILTMFKLIDGMHSTCSGTLRYVSNAENWSITSNPLPGDLVFWNPINDTTGHVGFYVNDGKVISNSDLDGYPIEHRLILKDGREPLSYWHFK